MQSTFQRSIGLLAAGAMLAAGVMLSPRLAQAQEPTAIKVGWAISKTGPNTAGATITLLNAYKLWVKDVNAAGGIMLKSVNKKLPVEVVEYDDRSNSEEMIKAVERLITQDKVDFVLPPWGTAFSVASAPIFARAGYPILFVTATTDRAPEFAKRWPNSFWLLGTATEMADSAVEVFSTLRKDGKIGANIAMVGVADEFGIQLSSASREAFKKAGFTLVYDKSYPLGTQDMQPILTEAMRTNADVFMAASYPPDTFAIIDQAKVLSYNPKVFFTAVGTAFPLIKQRFGANAEGIMGTGGWNADSPQLKDYLKRHTETNGAEPDRWANPVTYSSLQMLQQAIERVGKIDRAAVIKELQTGTFDTIMGKVKMVDNRFLDVFQTGQWQNGEYYGIGPARLSGARAPLFPKPAWKQ
ncbi:MAG TPA: amino acid ABC transporter substrate-binding protein [Xanthobacteraceae bacterium]|nr:amino acid ABC transporter substrate-binding protein [Xanthobacteraceae bacterium]